MIRAQSGFTLTEILVATGLMLFIIALMGGIWQHAYLGRPIVPSPSCAPISAPG